MRKFIRKDIAKFINDFEICAQTKVVSNVLAMKVLPWVSGSST